MKVKTRQAELPFDRWQKTATSTEPARKAPVIKQDAPRKANWDRPVKASSVAGGAP